MTNHRRTPKINCLFQTKVTQPNITYMHLFNWISTVKMYLTTVIWWWSDLRSCFPRDKNESAFFFLAFYHHHQVALTTRISYTLSLSFSLRPYNLSLSTSLPNYILCLHSPDVNKFLLVGQHWVRLCFSLRQCPQGSFRFTWIVFQMEGK